MSLNQAMEAARAAAENLPAMQNESSNGNTLSTIQYGTSLEDFLAGGGLNVDGYVQVKDDGIKLDRSEKAFIEEFEAELDISSVQMFVGIRAEFAGNNVQYAKSFDGGKTTNKGENFASVVAHYKENSLKPADTYRGADMALVLTNDVVQGKTTIPAGTRLGYTTPITGWTPFQNLLKKLVAEGRIQDVGGGRLELIGDPVKVKLTHEQRQNSAKQNYGVLLMELAS
jgi:hypothetical protein